MVGATAQNDQCVSCLPPCATCNTDGTCATCTSPYSMVTLAAGQSCFLCQDPRCMNRTSANAGTCTQCDLGYIAVNGVCQVQCSTAHCLLCTAGVCTACSPYFYLTADNSC